MNANCFKTVFSERLGCLIAVGEHACSQGKSSGEYSFGGAAFGASVLASAGVFIGALVLSQVFVGLAWAQPAANALPTGAAVVQGAASLAQSANQLHITQSTQRAAINWQSFDIGAAAKVNVVQPNAQAVLLNRVVGQSPSQIFGQLQANGHVILVNPNGVLFGKDGSVNAGSFTASTLGISDANFMAGNMVYERNGSTAGVVNQGTIQVSPGGYVALLGASVSNEGKIIAPKGGVALGAAETIKVPVTGSGRIKLELTAGDINASVKNSGAIVAEGGQVYMQALALNRAAAQILQSGRIDTTGEQGGAVHLLADGGTIKVDGSIKANSTGTDDKGQTRKGGDIVIGRDEETGALAKTTAADGAQLESRGGFVETSGDVLSTTGTRVKAAEWLLDPYNITIASSLPSGTAYSSNYTSAANSVILASDIAANLDAGTSVTIATGAGGASAGDINVNANIAKTAGGDASLTLKAHNDIVMAANTTITSTEGKLKVVLNSDSDGSGAGAILMNTGSGITSLGGHITLGGGMAGDGSGFARGHEGRPNGILFEGASLLSSGGNITLRGQSHSGSQTYDYRSAGIRLRDLHGNNVINAGSGQILLEGVSVATSVDSAYGIELGHYGAQGQTTQLMSSSNAATAIQLTGSGGQVGNIHRAGVYLNAKTTLSASGLGGVGIDASGGGVHSGGQVSYAFTSLSGSGINTANAALTATADSMSIAGTLNAGSGTVTLQNKSAGLLLNVGAADDVSTSPQSLGVSMAELGRITAGSLVLGRSDSWATGNVTVNAINLGALGNTSGNLTVLGNHITVNDNVTKTAGTDATLSLRARGDISVAANKTITATSGKLNVVLNSDSDGDNVGSIAMNSGSGITSNGGNIRLSGGLYHDSNLSWAYGTATSPHGITLTGTELSAGGGNISLRGASMTGNYLGHGVGITGGSIGTTGGGFIDIQGYSTAEQGFASGIAVLGANITGGSTGTTRLIGTNASNSNTNRQQGVWLNDAAGVTSLVTSTGGTVTVTGFGGGSSTSTNNFNYGVAVQNSLISSGGTGTVNVTGTGGTTTGINNAGVAFNGSSLSNGISSSGGVINVTGTGGAGGLSPGVWFVSGLNGSIQSGSNAAINLTTDSLVMDTGAINAGTGTVTVQNRTAGTLVNVGGADVLTGSPLTLGVSNAELARISAGSIVIGSTARQTGNLTVSSAITTPNASQFTLVSNNTITVNAAITNTSATAQTLNLNAENGIVQRANITATGAGQLNVVMNAKGLTDGVAVASMTAEQRALSHGIFVDTATINANSGDVTLNGTSYAASSSQISGVGKGVQIHNLSNITARHITITGVAENQSGGTSHGVVFQRYRDTANLNATGDITITGTLQGAGNGSGVLTNESGWGAQAPMVSAGGKFTLRGNNRGASSNTGAAIQMRSGMQVRAVGDVVVQAETNNAAARAMDFYSRATSVWTDGAGALEGNASFRSIDASGVASGNVLIQSNQGSIHFNNLTDPTLTKGALTTLTAITGRNVVIDNTGAGMLTGANNTVGSGNIDAVTGAILRGTGKSTSGNAGIQLSDGRSITASDSINLFGAGTTGSGVAISGASALSANVVSGTGNININGENTSSNGAAINISNASSTITANNVVKLTSSGTGSGTSLVAAGNITVGGELQVENPAAGSISGVVGGTGMLRKWGGTGAGTLVLTGANTYTGGTTANGGVLQVGNGGTTGTLGVGGGVSIGATLAVNRSDAFAINQDISGAGNLQQIGSGSTVLSGTNTYAGTTTITAGTLQVGAGGTTGSLGAGAVSVSSGAALNFNRSDALTVANAISGAGTVSQNGSGAGTSSNLSLTGYMDAATGVFNANHGTLTFNAAAASRKFNGSAININNGSTVRILSGTNLHYAFGTTWNFDSQGGGTIDASPQVNFVMGFGTTSPHNTFNSNGGVTNTIRGPHTGGINTNVAANVTTFNVAPGSTSVGLNVVADLWNSGTVTKTGAGLMQLTGQATGVYTGAINVTQGTLQVGDGGANGTLGSGAVNVSSGANVVMNRSDTVTVGNLISGAGNLTQAGAGTTILTGANTYSGTTTINAGHLHIGNGGGTGALGTGNVSINHADSQLVFNRTGAVTAANAISGVGRIVQRGTGAVKLSGDNSALSGGITVSRGTLMLGNGAGDTNKTAGTGAITLGDANTGASNITLEIESGHQPAGAGQVGLSADINVTALGTGTVTIASATGQGSGNRTDLSSQLSLARSITLHDGTGDRFGVNGAITGSGNITMAGTRISRSGANISNDFTGSVTVNSGTTLQANSAQIFSTKTDLQVNGTMNLMGGASQSIDSLTGSGSINSWNAFTSNPATLSVGNDNGSGTFSGTINTPTVANPVVVSLEKNGSGTQILSGNNTYTGTTTINGGTLQIGNAGTSGSIGSGVITNNSDLVFNRTDSALVVGAKISGTGTVTQAGTGMTTLSADNDWSGSTTISAGTLQIGNGGTTGTLGTSTSVTSNGTLAFKRSDNISVGQKITGTGGLTQAGTGKVTLIDSAGLNGVNDYSGVTTIVSGGTLEVGNGGTSGNLGSGTVTNNGSLIINRSDAVAISKAISGTGTLSQSGAGTTTLSGINTYSGGTNVVTGILKIGDGINNGQIGSGTVNIASGAVVDFNVKASSSANYSSTNTFTGTGTLKKSGGGTLTWGSASGVFAMTGGVIDVQAGSLTGSSSGNEVWTNNKASLNVAAGAIFAGVEGNIVVDALTGGGTVFSGYSDFAYGLTVGINNGSGTFSGRIEDSNGQAAKLTKTGTGTQILTGANSYTGVTTVSGGVLQVGNGGATGALGSGGITNNASLIFNRSNTQTVTNDISGSGTLTQSGTGTTILTGSNSYTGTTTISTGTLQVGNGGASGTLGTGAVVDNASLVFNRSDALVVTNAISGTGTLTQSGAGTTTLAADNSYAGTTSVSGGTLQVGNGGSTGTLGAGAVTLSNNATLRYVRSVDTTIANTISGAGNVSASITGSGSDLAVNTTIAITGGTVNLAADGNLSVTQAISTNNTTANAMVLTAGAATSAGTASGGDITVTGSGDLTVGTGGRATLYTGSLLGSTGLGVTTGFNRYNSDELTSNFDTTALGSGTYAIYREAPTVSVRFNDASKTYNAQAFAGGNGLTQVSGFVNGDTDAQLGSISYNGTSQGAINAGTYVISGTALSGLGYALTYTDGALTVGKALATVTANSGTVTYNAQTQSVSGFTASGLVGGETAAVLTGVSTAGGSGRNAGSYTHTASGTDSNYDVSFVSGTLQIDKATASVNGTATNVTYNGAIQNQSAPTSNGFIAGDNITISGAASGKNAGTYTSNLTVTGNDAGNYDISITDANLVVGKALATVTANSGTVTYNAQTQSVSGFTASGLVGGETAAVLNGVITSGGSGRNAGSYSHTASGTDNNYDLSFVSGTLQIDKAMASVSGTATNVTYNGATQNQSAPTSTGFFAGDAITIAGVASGKNAGSYASNLSVTGNDANNYDISITGANLVIGKAALTATGNSSSVTYNGANQTVTGFTVTGLQGTDAVSDLTSVVAAGATGKNVGSYTNAVTAGTENNYTVSTVDGTLAIGKASLIATGNSSSVTYNGTNQTVTGFTVSGLLGSDTVSDLTTVVAAGATGKNAGSYTNAVTAGTETNYTVTTNNGTLSIGKAALTATGNSSSVTYNGANQTVTGFTVTGLQGADTVNDLTSVVAAGATGKNAGSYTNAVTAGTETNYTVTTVNGLLTIDKADLTLSGTRVYDAGTTFAGQYLRASGVVGETFTVSGSGDVTNLNSKNVQNAQSLSSVAGLSLGSSANGGLVSNYKPLSTVGSSVSITPKQLSASGAVADKIYDGTLQASLGDLAGSGVLSGDQVVFQAASAVFADKNVARDASGLVLSKAVTVSGLSLDGADAGNYQLATNSFTSQAKILPKTLTAALSVQNKSYDGNTLASVSMGGVSGLVGAESIQATALGLFDSATAGSNKPVSVRYRWTDGSNGGLASNYELPSQILRASILSPLGGNPVQPMVVPTPSAAGGLSVMFGAASGLAELPIQTALSVNRQGCAGSSGRQASASCQQFLLPSFRNQTSE